MSTRDFVAHKVAILALVIYFCLPIVQFLPKTIRTVYIAGFFALFFVTAPKSLFPVLLSEIFIILLYLFGLYYISQENENIFQFIFVRFWFWIPFLMMITIQKIRDISFCKILSNTILLVFILTSITTIFGLTKFPYASRELASGRHDQYLSLNIGGYGFINSIALIMPLLVANQISEKRSILVLVSIPLFYICIFMSQYGTPAIMSVILSGLVIIVQGGRKAKTRFFISALFLFVLILLMIVFWNNILQYLSDKGLNILVRKLHGLEITIRYNETFSDLDARISKYTISLQSFIQSPLWGSIFNVHGKQTGGHSFILDTIATFGILGILFILHIANVIFRGYKSIKFDNKISPTLLVFWLGVVMLALGKTFSDYTMAVVTFLFSSSYQLNNWQDAGANMPLKNDTNFRT